MIQNLFVSCIDEGKPTDGFQVRNILRANDSTHDRTEAGPCLLLQEGK